MSETTLPKAHPFELSGMGTGPYRFCGIASIPSSSLAEANPSAYNAALAALPRNISGGLGTCRHCGTAIMHNCIILDAQGVRYAVGSDCILKLDDPCLGDKVKVAVARRVAKQRRELKEAKAEAKRQQWLASVCNAAGETNAQRLDRERDEKAAAEAKAQAERKAEGAKYAWLSSVLWANSRQEGDFCHNLSRQIENGRLPTGRALQICGEIYARGSGRTGSKAYLAAYEDFENRLGFTQE